MADIQTLKGKITSTIYPNGKGAINAADHQALLLDVADTIADVQDGVSELSQTTDAKLTQLETTTNTKLTELSAEISELGKGTELRTLYMAAETEEEKEYNKVTRQMVLDGKVVVGDFDGYRTSIFSEPSGMVGFQVYGALKMQEEEDGLANEGIYLVTYMISENGSIEYGVSVLVNSTDNKLSTTSSNAIQNKVVTNAINQIEAAVATKVDEDKVKALIFQEHAYFKYVEAENKVYFKGYVTPDWTILIPYMINVVIGKPLTFHFVIVGENGENALGTNKFEVINSKDKVLCLTWIYNDLKYTLTFGENDSQVITNEPYDAGSSYDDTEVRELIDERNIAAIDVEGGAEAPDINGGGGSGGGGSYDDTEIKNQIAALSSQMVERNVASIDIDGGADAPDINEGSGCDDTDIRNQLSQKQDKLTSGGNIKTINGVSVLGSGNLDTHYAVVNTSATSVALLPNTYYKFSGSVLNVTLGASTTNLSEYVIELTINGTPSITFPSSVKWANTTAPNFENGKTYIVSIINNLGVYAAF